LDVLRNGNKIKFGEDVPLLISELSMRKRSSQQVHLNQGETEGISVMQQPFENKGAISPLSLQRERSMSQKAIQIHPSSNPIRKKHLEIPFSYYQRTFNVILKAHFSSIDFQAFIVKQFTFLHS
jgi:hypothetical protein